MVVGNHLFSFFDKKFREGVTRYELHPPSLRTVYFPTAPFLFPFLTVHVLLGVIGMYRGMRELVF